MKNILNKALKNPLVPIAFEDLPGHAKTSRIESFAKANNLPFVKLLASSMDETDIAGIYVKDIDSNGNTTVNLISPSWFSKLKTKGLLFLDEFNCARREVQDTMLTLICNRELPNGDRLGDNVLIVAAMNNSAMINGTELSPAMKNRFGWFSSAISSTDWLLWYNDQPIAAQKKDITQLIFNLIISHDFKFTAAKDFLNQNLATTPRSLLNLIEFSDNVLDFQCFASNFLAEKEALQIQAFNIAELKNIPNDIFKYNQK